MWGTWETEQFVMTSMSVQRGATIVIRARRATMRLDHLHARAILAIRGTAFHVPTLMSALFEHTIVTRMRLAPIHLDHFNAAAIRDSLALVFSVNQMSVFCRRTIATSTLSATTHLDRFIAHATKATMETDSRVQRLMNAAYVWTIVTDGGRHVTIQLDRFDARAILDIQATASHASMWTNAPLDSTIATQPLHAQIQPVPFNVLAIAATPEMESHVKTPTSVRQ
jgi:hypothetical protein